MVEVSPVEHELEQVDTELVGMVDKYRGLLEAAPDAMVVVNAQGEIVLLNVQAEKRFGYHRDELLGQQVTNIIPAGFAERLVADALRTKEDALAQQIETGIELLGLRKDRSEFPIEIMLSPLESADGTLVTAAIRDISVRRAADEYLAEVERRRTLMEDELRESEERYRMLLDGVHDYAIFMMDPEGQVLSWNAGAERIKGYTAEEIIGENFSRLFPARDVQKGRPQEILRITAEAGRHEEQGIRLRKDGSRFLSSVTFTALHDANGELKGFSEFSNDLSESKEASAKYRGLLEAAPDAMVVINSAGEIVLLNLQAEKQFGYHRDELVGQQVRNIIPLGFAERLIADDLRSAEEALGQQMGAGIELSGLRKDGTEFPIEIMLSPLESAEGLLITAAIRNISVRKAAAAHLQSTVEALGRSNAELQAFTNLASHDLQEPLRKILTFGGRLESGEHGLSEQGADYIRRMCGAAGRMQALIQNLISYSRVTGSNEPFHRIALDAVLADVLTDLEIAIEKSGAIIQTSKLPETNGDETQMRELFQNLIANAIKFRKDSAPPRIFIEACAGPKGMQAISVRDDGLGFDAAHAEKIFGMFQRLHGREQFEGTGIGLAVCRKIADRHGGSISATSSPGDGTRFTVLLPTACSAPEGATP
ncbi:MAG: PAS domain S-box protein [bacterium]